MSLLKDLERRASLRGGTIVLPEGEDARVLKAADRLARARVAEVSVLGVPERVGKVARQAGVTLGRVKVLDCGQADLIARTDTALGEARGDRLAKAQRERLSREPLFQAATLVREGSSEAYVAGAVNSTGDVLRSALWLLGTAPGVETVSSFFAMVRSDQNGEQVYFFADGGVVPDPTPNQLADIAIATADNFATLMQREPMVAMLSFATKGSASHPRIDRVLDALAQVRARRPDIQIDGELQVDAALSPEVAKVKAPDSQVAGQANVLIFPDLDSGNIGYKLVQRLGGWQAVGPLLQGVAKPVNDLSRGASELDIFHVSLFAMAQAARLQAARPPSGSAEAGSRK
jgi:phosphate acetyltransferase